MIVNIFLLVLVFVRLVIGARLFMVGRNNNLPNLIWLALSMLVTAIGLLFAPTEGNPLGNLPISIWVFLGASIVPLIPIIIFNQLTFYKDRKSPALWVWIVFIICFVFALYGAMISKSNYEQSPWITAYAPAVILIWAWHGRLAYQALKPIASQPAVEYWVKIRYRLITVYSIVLIIGVVVSFVRIVFAGGSALSVLGSVTGLITLLAQIASVALMFLAWVMPEGFRLWLNRSHQAFVDEQAYEQAFAILNILGTSMSDGTKLPKTLALVAIRKTIGNEISSEDSKKIENYAIRLGYDQWYTFLNDPYLYRFLREVANVNPQDVLGKAKQTLRENQSLFTLQAK